MPSFLVSDLNLQTLYLKTKEIFRWGMLSSSQELTQNVCLGEITLDNDYRFVYCRENMAEFVKTFHILQNNRGKSRKIMTGNSIDRDNCSRIPQNPPHNPGHDNPE